MGVDRHSLLRPKIIKKVSQLQVRATEGKKNQKPGRLPSANLIIQNILWLQLIFLIQNLKFGTSVEFEQGFAP